MREIRVIFFAAIFSSVTWADGFGDLRAVHGRAEDAKYCTNEALTDISVGFTSNTYNYLSEAWEIPLQQSGFRGDLRVVQSFAMVHGNGSKKVLFCCIVVQTPKGIRRYKVKSYIVRDYTSQEHPQRNSTALQYIDIQPTLGGKSEQSCPSE